VLREVTLPPETAGRLFLSHMPGRSERFTDTEREIIQAGVNCVVRLAPMCEVRHKSQEYARAIEAGRLQWQDKAFDVRDYGVPDDRKEFLGFAREVADNLRSGGKIVIHCVTRRVHYRRWRHDNPVYFLRFTSAGAAS